MEEMPLEESEGQLADAEPALQSTASLSLDLPADNTSSPFSVAVDATGDDQPPSTNGTDQQAPLSTQPSSSLFHRELPRSSIEIYAFGRTDFSQLGYTSQQQPEQNTSAASPQQQQNEEDIVPHPQLLTSLAGKDIVSTSAGAYHSAAITVDGELYLWGSNAEGACGRRRSSSSSSSATDSTTSIVSTPTRIESLEAFSIGMAACGENHTLSVAENGFVFAFGNAEYGQLGLPGITTTTTTVELPKRITALGKTRIARVAAGGAHSLALSTGGAVYSFGDASSGALGRPLSNNNTDTTDSTTSNKTKTATPSTTEAGILAMSKPSPNDYPAMILKLWPLGVVQIAAGEAHSAVLTVDGAVYTWGRGKQGQLGLGNFSNNPNQPKLVQALSGLKINQIACGANHTIALTFTGDVYSWGNGTWGATGLGCFDNTCTPQKIKSLAEAATHITQVSAGGRHTLILTSTGSVIACGCNESGQLGLGDVDVGSNIAVPRLVQGLPKGASAVFVCAGGEHSFVAIQPSCSSSTTTTTTTTTTTSDNATIGGQATTTNLSGVIVGGGSSSGKNNNYNKQQDGGHGDKWQPLTIPSLQELQLAAENNDSVRYCAALERIFSNPGYLSVAFSDERTAVLTSQSQHHHQQQQQQQHQEEDNMQVDETAAADTNITTTTTKTEATVPMDIDSMDADSIAELASSTTHKQMQNEVDSVVKLWSLINSQCTALHDEQCQPLTVLFGHTISLLDTLEAYLQDYKTTTPNTTTNIQNQQQEQRLIDLPKEIDWLPWTLFILLQSPINALPAHGRAVMLRIAAIISSSIPPEQRAAVRYKLQTTLELLPPPAFATITRNIQKHITSIAQSGRIHDSRSRLEVMMLGILLDVLREANDSYIVTANRGSSSNTTTSSAAATTTITTTTTTSGSVSEGIIPYDKFNNEALSNALDLQAEYVAWMKHRGRTPHALVSLCQLPFLLTPEAKSYILHGESMIQKHQHMTHHAMQAFFHGGNPNDAGFLNLRIRRTHIVEDALNALVYGGHDLKRPMRVTFISAGGIDEEAEDAGGVTKELFQLLSHDLFRPEYGMFTYDDSTRTYWLNPASLEAESEFELVGQLLGLAIFNDVLLDVRFPLVLYKKLLNQQVTLSDVKAGFPELGKGLQALLDYEPAADVENVFCLDFTAEYPFYGEMRKVELKPGGADIAVTGANRKEYVDRFVQWYLVESIESQFVAFRNGFGQLCGFTGALTMFMPSELELLICGLPHLDFNQLKAAAKYEGGYTGDSQAILWFWEVVQSLPIDQKKSFLRFTTGSDRSPVGGLAKIALCVQRSSPDSDRLPTSHTCFNVLLLPDYASKNKLERMLLTAIENASGFGLR